MTSHADIGSHPAFEVTEHRPWPLQEAEAVFRANTMLRPHGIELYETTPVLLHFARRIDVVVWNPTRL